MKTMVFFSLVCGISVGLFGCGHHVIYQQVVKTETSVNTASSSVEQTGLSPAPVMVNHRAQSPHLRGVMLQQYSSTGASVPAGQVRAMITPQQQKTLMMVPVSALNHQGVVYPSVQNVPMVRIPVMALPAQALQQQQVMMGYSQQAHQTLESRIKSGELDHLKATPSFEVTEREGESLGE